MGRVVMVDDGTPFLLLVVRLFADVIVTDGAPGRERQLSAGDVQVMLGLGPTWYVCGRGWLEWLGSVGA